LEAMNVNPWKEKCDRAIKEWREQGESGVIIMHPETVEDVDYVMAYMELVQPRPQLIIITGLSAGT
jgi:hypothetical protein